MTFAGALSRHGATKSAVADALGLVLAEFGGEDAVRNTPPDLVLLFVTPPHAGKLQEAAATVASALHTDKILGCAAISVVGGVHEVEAEPAVSLWAGHIGRVETFGLEATPTADGAAFTGWPDRIPDDPSALLLVADPFTFPVDDLLARMALDRPGLPIVGGLASAASEPGGNRLILGSSVKTTGAVAAFLPPSVEVTTVVSQGCRPVGKPFVVTKGENNVVYELAGRPALTRLQDMAARMSDAERLLLSRHVHLGRVIDESKVDFGRGDFLVRNVIGADPDVGAVAVGDRVEVGSTAQFQVRDAESADEDLRELMADRLADAALVFTCNGRGTNLFGQPDHDAAIVSECLGGVPVAGMFCAGELGPIGGRNFLHGFTASVVLFRSTAYP